MDANSVTTERMDAGTYVEMRVEDQLNYYEKAANRAKRTFMWMQTSVIVLGLLVPVIVNIPASWGSGLGRWDQFVVQATGVGATFVSLT